MPRSFISIFLFISVLISARSQPTGFTTLKSTDQLAAGLRDYAARVKSIESDFTQDKHMEYLDVALESSGKFWYQSPDKVRWEYTHPYKYVMILNQGKLDLVSDKSSNQIDMQGNDIFMQINDLMVSSVNGNIFGNKNYTVEAFEGKDSYLVILTPTSASIRQMVGKMEISFDKHTFAVSSIKMIESDADYSIITFTNLQFNASIPETTFRP